MDTLLNALQTALQDLENTTLAQSICGTAHPHQIAQHIEQFSYGQKIMRLRACSISGVPRAVHDTEWDLDAPCLD